MYITQVNKKYKIFPNKLYPTVINVLTRTIQYNACKNEMLQ